jgi:membrane-associated protease RseP (regulator of RpoE activity)
VHPFFWLVAVLLGPWRSAPGEHVVILLLIWVVAVFISILIHEMGHAVAMRAYGFRPWITLYGLGGLASYNHAQAYGSRGDRPLGQILISAAGPGAGFLFAGLIVGVLFLTGHLAGIRLGGPIGFVFVFQEFPSERVFDFIQNLLFINIAWGMINLLPVYPLDGGQMMRELLTVRDPRQGIRQSLIISIFTAGGFAVWAAVKWQSIFVAVLFGYLAFTSYMALQAYEGRNRPW